MAVRLGSREAVVAVLRTLTAQGCSCPAHSQFVPSRYSVKRPVSNSPLDKEYAFEMASSNIRFGPGVTREVGMDLVNLRVNNVCILTDKNVCQLPPMRAALDAVQAAGISYSVFDDVSIEPTDSSFQAAIAFAKSKPFDGFLAVGGGSVMDTAKAANLYSCCPENDFMDFVNYPIGKGLPITKSLKPLVCIPTTAGTASETTGTATFDYKPLQAKTGIANRALRPTLGLVDPLHMKHMPYNVTVFSGFDVLCHAVEAYTAIPYNERTPCPTNPNLRPAYQGSNPISDIWCLETFRVMKKYFRRSVKNPDDTEARFAMTMASTCAGIGFGNAGVHLPHGMSYPISGLVKSFVPQGYNPDKPIVPHGLAVVLTAPAVFEFTAPMNPERHLLAAELLGADVSRVARQDAGKVLADVVRSYMHDMGVVDGISAVGYTSEDIPGLVKGTIPQHRVTKLCPRPLSEEVLSTIFEKSLTVY